MVKAGVEFYFVFPVGALCPDASQIVFPDIFCLLLCQVEGESGSLCYPVGTGIFDRCVRKTCLDGDLFAGAVSKVR